MDPKTIQRFGNIKGVDALLYGKVLEATAEGKNGIVRLNLTLSSVETGQLLWTGNVTGKYTGEQQVTNLAPKIAEAGIDVGGKISEQLNKKLINKKVNIFTLPFTGKVTSELADIIVTEIQSNNTNDQVKYYSEPKAINQGMLRGLSYKLAGEGAGLPPGSLNKIIKQLDQLYDLPENRKEGTNTEETAIINAYLIASLISSSGDDKAAQLMFTYKVRDCADNRVIAGGTITGYSNAPKKTKNEEVEEFYNENSSLIRLIIIAAISITVLLSIVLIVRMLTRPR
jgi:hypothetical protein